MEQWMANVGALGVVTMYLGEKIIAIMGKGNGNLLTEAMRSIADSNQKINIMLELMQERMRYHEESATRRHLEVLTAKEKCREDCEKEHGLIRGEIVDLSRRGIS